MKIKNIILLLVFITAIGSYFIFNQNESETKENKTEAEIGVNDDIIGMTIIQAENYAENNNVDFRVGTIDGEPMPVTLDFRPGRITAEIQNDLVIGYTVE